MKKIELIIAVTILAVLAGVGLASSMEEQRLSGNLYLEVVSPTGAAGNSSISREQNYRLSLYNPIFFAKGTRSERVVRDIGLVIPADMREKVLKLEDKHVLVEGPMDCTMHYSPWTASCDMTVRQIDTAK